MLRTVDKYIDVDEVKDKGENGIWKPPQSWVYAALAGASVTGADGAGDRGHGRRGFEFSSQVREWGHDGGIANLSSQCFIVKFY